MIDPVSGMLGLICLCLLGVILIELHADGYRRRVDQRVDALMLAHNANHAKRCPEQATNDNRQQDNAHLFVSY